jgi:G3E family GTPase
MAKLDPPPDHLLIESSGVAIPSAIVGSISLLDGFRVDGTVILADAETVQANAASKYMSDTVLRQISDANIIVLNKTDLVESTELAATRDWLKLQNPDARIVDAQQGIVPPEAVLASFLGRATSVGHHHHLGNFETSTLTLENPVDVEELAQKLASEDYGLIRAKGFATSLSGQKMLIQVVGNRWDVSDAPAHMADGIVCLGYKDEARKMPLSQS